MFNTRTDDELELEAALRALAQRFRAARLEKGISQEAVAHAAGIAVSTYTRFERLARRRSTRAPSFITLLRISQVLGLSEPFALIAEQSVQVNQ